METFSSDKPRSMPYRFIDLFCGIGGFRFAAQQVFEENRLKYQCVFSSDIDKDAQKAYEANFGERPSGDITKIDSKDIPDHDILFGGFPCQSFSIIGDRKGFEDTRGTLFFDIARILKEKRPAAFVLENVKQLVTHQSGKTFSRIIETLNTLGYQVQSRVLNALNFGVPQKRERVFIVGFREPRLFHWPAGVNSIKSLSDVLEQKVPKSYFASKKVRLSALERTKNKRKLLPSIWHENKGGNISIHPYSCALRAGASYNYLLVNGTRRLTEREMLRLQGFPENFKIVCGYSATRKQAGNSVAVPCVTAVVRSVVGSLLSEPLAAGQICISPKQTEFAFKNQKQTVHA